MSGIRRIKETTTLRKTLSFLRFSTKKANPIPINGTIKGSKKNTIYNESVRKERNASVIARSASSVNFLFVFVERYKNPIPPNIMRIPTESP